MSDGPPKDWREPWRRGADNINALRANNALIRRHYIRRVLLDEWQAGRGVDSLERLAALMLDRFNMSVKERILRYDLEAIHAMKITQAGIRGSFWVIPPWRLDMAEVAKVADQETVMNEVTSRLYNYALDSVAAGNLIFIFADRFCGRMIGEWIGLLNWPEILHVVSYDHSVQIICINSTYAQTVYGRLLGDKGVTLLTEDEREAVVYG